jgi:hypothetical protein
VEVPRDLLVAVRGELRAWSGHWAEGFTANGQPLVQHDQRMDDGSCLSCSLLELLDGALHPGPPPCEVAERVTEVVNLGARRRLHNRPPGVPLGRRH